jgi:hypothetical protein
VLVIGTEENIFKAAEDRQLGYVEENIVLRIKESLTPGQLLVFRTDGTDPAVQPCE